MRASMVCAALCPALCALRSQLSGGKRKSSVPRSAAAAPMVGALESYKLHAALLADNMQPFIDAAIAANKGPSGAVFVARQELRSKKTRAAVERADLFKQADDALGQLCDAREGALHALGRVSNAHSQCVSVRAEGLEVSERMEDMLGALEEQADLAVERAREQRKVFERALRLARKGVRDVLLGEAAHVYAFAGECAELGRQFAPAQYAEAGALAMVLVEKWLMAGPMEDMRKKVAAQPREDIAAVVAGDDDVIEVLGALGDAELGDAQHAATVADVSKEIGERRTANAVLIVAWRAGGLHPYVVGFNGKRMDMHEAVLFKTLKDLSSADVVTCQLAIELAIRIRKHV